MEQRGQDQRVGDQPGGNQRGVCVVGSLTMDLVVACDHLPRVGQTAFGRSFESMPGGKGACQAVAAARAGAAVSLVGRVGRDHNGRELRSLLQRERVDVIGVAESWSAPTGATAIMVDRRGEHAALVVPGANDQLEPGYVEESRRRIENAAVLLVQLEVPIAAVTRAAELAKAAGARVVLNVAPAREIPQALIGLLDVIVVNMFEARAVTGLADAAEAAVEEALAKLGVPVAVLTKGSAGATVLTREGRDHVPSHPVQAIDTTGAGDTFIGSLGACWAMAANGGRTPPMEALRAALDYASAAGSLATTRRGSIAAIPGRAEVERLMTQPVPGAG